MSVQESKTEMEQNINQMLVQSRQEDIEGISELVKMQQNNS